MPVGPNWQKQSVWMSGKISRKLYIDGLMQERQNSIVNALELSIFIINPLI